MVASVMNQSNNEIDMVGTNDRLVESYYKNVSDGKLVWKDWFFQIHDQELFYISGLNH